MTDEKADDSFTQGFDSSFLIQLLQNNNELTERYYNSRRRKKWISPLGISVVILYGIMSILILHQMLCENRSDNSEPQKEAIIRMRYNIKELEDDVAYLKMQNLYLISRFRIPTRNQSSMIKYEKYVQNETLHANETNIDSNEWNTSAPIEHINNVTQEFESQFILERNQLNTSLNAREQRIEQRLFDRLSEKIIQEISKKSMSFQELLMKGSNESSSSMGQDFITFQELIIKTLGGSEKESGVMLRAIKNSFIRDIRSCHDYKRLGITENGFYEINLGSPPSNFSSVHVFCDFTSNSTYLYHNSVEGANVTACEEDACFQHNLTYTASPEQIKLLIRNSRHCQQSIRFRCFHASLKNHGAWYDSFGDKQNYFTGSNYGKHFCQCFRTWEGCSGLPSVNRCNCDASLHPAWLEDVGHITNKTALPISRFTYGQLYSEKSQRAFIQIGPLNCTGEVKGVSYLSNEHDRTIMAKWNYFDMKTYGILHENGTLHIKTPGYYLTYCNNLHMRHLWKCPHLKDFDSNIKYFPLGHQIDISETVEYATFEMYLLKAET